jgi:hypothetical protein
MLQIISSPASRYRSATVLTVAALCTCTTVSAVTTIDETDLTESAVLAVEDHWLRAEGTGDTAYLESMLLPEYRTVNPGGVVASKSSIIARAERNRGSGKAMQEIEAYMAAHPSGKKIVMQGDVAIVSFFAPELGPEKALKSSDIFLHVDGRWRALYSQHSTSEN